MAKEKKQATWGGRFKEGPAELMLRFSESISFDWRLAPYDVQVSKAHAAMLAHIGLISAKDRDAIRAGLDAVLADIRSGKLVPDIACEDVHMNIEQALTKKTPAGARLHAARSRNDQVATDMRLFFKDACGQVAGRLRALLAVIVDLAEKYQDIVIPGYTHLQRAQPVSLAHHLLAWAQMFGRDLERFEEVARRANVCPLGSGAIAGSTLPIDRAFVAKELGFVDSKGRPQFTANSMDAVADRDLFIEFASAGALCGVHLSRVSEDGILWNSAEFGYVRFSDAFTTGSSLMPQKKNPDALELLRGKSARLQGNLQTLLTLTKGLPLTYNRDLQEDKPPVFDTFDTLMISLDVLAGTLAGMTVRADKCAAAVADPLLLATDLADYLVARGVPFRDAHHAIGALVGLAEEKAVPLNELPFAAVKKVNAAFAEDWTEVFDLKRALKLRERPGMPGPKQTAREITAWRKRLG
jgi:argininosuccinate lyase